MLPPGLAWHWAIFIIFCHFTNRRSFIAIRIMESLVCHLLSDELDMDSSLLNIIYIARLSLLDRCWLDREISCGRWSWVGLAIRAYIRRSQEWWPKDRWQVGHCAIYIPKTSRFREKSWNDQRNGKCHSVWTNKKYCLWGTQM